MLQQLKGLRRSISYVMKKGAICQGESFLLKMDYKRVRGWTYGESISV